MNIEQEKSIIVSMLIKEGWDKLDRDNFLFNDITEEIIALKFLLDEKFIEQMSDEDIEDKMTDEEYEMFSDPNDNYPIYFRLVKE